MAYIRLTLAYRFLSARIPGVKVQNYHLSCIAFVCMYTAGRNEPLISEGVRAIPEQRIIISALASPEPAKDFLHNCRSA